MKRVRKWLLEPEKKKFPKLFLIEVGIFTLALWLEQPTGLDKEAWNFKFMDDTKEKEIEITDEITPSTEELVAPEVVSEVAPEVILEKTETPKRDREFKKNTRKPGRREVRVRAKPEFDNKLLEVRRVARVVSGGRRFSFSTSIVVGDRKGRVGVGVGKAADTPIAIEKAFRDGKKNMVTVLLTPQSSIPHSVEAKYGASRLTISPAPGKGIIAGSSVRAVLELAGVTAVSAKILSRSKNKINNARAAIKALQKLKIR